MTTRREAVCITCGDVAVEMRVIEVDAERALALCESPRGERSTVEIALVQPVAAGDGVLVHAGTAIAHLDRPATDAGAPGHEAEEVPGRCL